MDKHHAIRIALRGIHGPERSRIALNLMSEPKAINPILRARLAKPFDSAAYKRKWRAKRKRDGICVRCPRPTDGVHSTCLDCRRHLKAKP